MATYFESKTTAGDRVVVTSGSVEVTLKKTVEICPINKIVEIESPENLQSPSTTFMMFIYAIILLAGAYGCFYMSGWTWGWWMWIGLAALLSGGALFWSQVKQVKNPSKTTKVSFLEEGHEGDIRWPLVFADLETATKFYKAVQQLR